MVDDYIFCGICLVNIILIIIYIWVAKFTTRKFIDDIKARRKKANEDGRTLGNPRERGYRRIMQYRQRLSRENVRTMTVLFTLLILLPVFIPTVFFTCTFVPSETEIHNGGGVQVTGLCRPSGEITFYFEPDVKSINGQYRATVEIEPQLTEAQTQKGITWSRVSKDVGDSWDNLIFDAPEKSFSFDIRITIPNDPDIADEIITLSLYADIEYPTHSGGSHFVTSLTTVEEEMEITIGPPLTSMEIFMRENVIWISSLMYNMTVIWIIIILILFFVQRSTALFWGMPRKDDSENDHKADQIGKNKKG